MEQTSKTSRSYGGFEQGPIRPPSEANSLLIRVTRNCPWNQCTFCPVYKGQTFSVRPLEHVLKDIDDIHGYVDKLREVADPPGLFNRREIDAALQNDEINSPQALSAAYQWYRAGMTSVFLQDANSLIIKTADILAILSRLKKHFPWIKRITSYARSHTIARISDENMQRLSEGGLSRIHVGMESGSDAVLKKIRKGAQKATHIKAGIRVKKAGIELSEYVMPGLGGRELTAEHARETADAVNQINPDFIRLRTLAIPENTELYSELKNGTFLKLGDLEMAREVMAFIGYLEGITSALKSDHILNLFQEVEGRLPDDKPKMLNVFSRFLALTSGEQVCYQVGRRLGIFGCLADMADSGRMERVKKVCRENHINEGNVDSIIDEQ